MGKRRCLCFVLVLLTVGGCEGRETTGSMNSVDPAMNTESAVQAVSASAVLRDRQNNAIGTVELSEIDGGVRLDAIIASLPSGEHGFHIHETGRCEPPDFESAGGHFNPTDGEHGADEPEGSHVGDMANLVIAPGGNASTTREVEGASLGDGLRSLLRAGGTALVIHQRPDDYVTDPSGAAGPRLACGVIELQSAL